LVSSPFSFSFPGTGSCLAHGWKYVDEHSFAIHRRFTGRALSSCSREDARRVEASRAGKRTDAGVVNRAANTAIPSEA
jgi:hypothetical protein